MQGVAKPAPEPKHLRRVLIVGADRDEARRKISVLSHEDAFLLSGLLAVDTAGADDTAVAVEVHAGHKVLAFWNPGMSGIREHLRATWTSMDRKPLRTQIED